MDSLNEIIKLIEQHQERNKQMTEQLTAQIDELKALVDDVVELAQKRDA